MKDRDGCSGYSKVLVLSIKCNHHPFRRIPGDRSSSLLALAFGDTAPLALHGNHCIKIRAKNCMGQPSKLSARRRTLDAR